MLGATSSVLATESMGSARNRPTPTRVPPIARYPTEVVILGNVRRFHQAPLAPNGMTWSGCHSTPRPDGTDSTLNYHLPFGHLRAQKTRERDLVPSVRPPSADVLATAVLAWRVWRGWRVRARQLLPR